MPKSYDDFVRLCFLAQFFDTAPNTKHALACITTRFCTEGEKGTHMLAYLCEKVTFSFRMRVQLVAVAQIE